MKEPLQSERCLRKLHFSLKNELLVKGAEAKTVSECPTTASEGIKK